MAPRYKRCARGRTPNPGVASIASQPRVFGKDGDEEDSGLIVVGEREIDLDSIKLHIERLYFTRKDRGGLVRDLKNKLQTLAVAFCF
ncbi:hypothetical protein MKW98_010432 [Papaver atlanticum]|uniref:Uncharacterized protein n=1 Tax=Papaver atlanticum TaxID=357466 RepID=A0AAD4XTB8_9MAGN|nr:hypothetical protein MKW98_010432 [Papaver atlanticum]